MYLHSVRSIFRFFSPAATSLDGKTVNKISSLYSVDIKSQCKKAQLFYVLTFRYLKHKKFFNGFLSCFSSILSHSVLYKLYILFFGLGLIFFLCLFFRINSKQMSVPRCQRFTGSRVSCSLEGAVSHCPTCSIALFLL